MAIYKMTKTYLLFITFIIGTFMLSCEKDDIEFDNSTTQNLLIDQRSFNQEDCGFMENFCSEKRIPTISYYNPIPFDPNPNTPCEEHPCLTGTDPDDQSRFTVHPIKLYDGTIAVYFSDSNEEYIALSSESEISGDDVLERDIPNVVDKILEIRFRDIENGSLVLEDLQGSPLISTRELSNGKFQISTSIGSPVSGRLVRPCIYERKSSVESFVNVFFDDENDQGHIRDLIENAYENAEGDDACSIANTTTTLGECRYDCIDPRCIVDNLLGLSVDQGLSEYQKNVLVARYLDETIGLTLDEINFLSLPSNTSFTSNLYNQMASELDLGNCEKEDCSMKYSIETLIGLEMNGQVSAMTDSEQFEFYANLYCCDEPALLNEIEDVKLNGYPDPTTDAILQGMSNMCCGANPMDQSEFASLLAEQLSGELTSIGESWPTDESFFDDDFFEIMFAMMKEIVPELIPGVDTALELKRSFEAYNNGDYWQSAENFGLAMLTVTPADKCRDFIKVSKTSRKGFKIFRLFGKLKELNPALAKGFKETLLKLQKNDKIFRDHPGHWPDLKGVTKFVGGKENLVFDVYKKVFDSGILNAIPTNTPIEFNIMINGVHIRGTVIKLSNGTIRIDDFWIP